PPLLRTQDNDMDKIHIIDLLARCIIGLNPEERREKQDVLVNVTLEVDLRRAGKSDSLAYSVDYRTIKKRLLAMTEESSYFLLEALAERMAAICLESPAVRRAQVRVEKPSALRFARSVGVEITRAQGEQYARAYIGVGANINPADNIRQALRLLAEHATPAGISTFYCTPPADGSEQPAFYNGVIAIDTPLPPRELKSEVLRPIEDELGRVRTNDKNAPRPIDLDILCYDDLEISAEDLTLPDPQLPARAFLAVPLAELAPELALPDGRRLRDLAAALPRDGMEPLPDFTDLLRKDAAHGPQEG
ncbi:MAG: 2-amino-4-hydroxy-6-hydroxymethyldihydropteridine diphosphokinase, partial [Armatimonadota bacterium]